jgi:hypothetical protein
MVIRTRGYRPWATQNTSKISAVVGVNHAAIWFQYAGVDNVF